MTLTRRGNERGSATLWMVFGTVIVLATAGLVFDGGALISTKRDVINQAGQAARAGAQAIDVVALYSDANARQLDPPAAIARANEFIAANGWTGTATADTTSVTVTISRLQQMTFLQTVGVSDRTVTGTATARARQGLTGP